MTRSELFLRIDSFRLLYSLEIVEADSDRNKPPEKKRNQFSVCFGPTCQVMTRRCFLIYTSPHNGAIPN